MQKSRASMVAVVVGMKTGEGKHRINARGRNFHPAN